MEREESAKMKSPSDLTAGIKMKPTGKKKQGLGLAKEIVRSYLKVDIEKKIWDRRSRYMNSLTEESTSINQAAETMASKDRVNDPTSTPSRRSVQYQLLASKSLTRKVSAFYSNLVQLVRTSWVASSVPLTLEQFIQWSTADTSRGTHPTENSSSPLVESRLCCSPTVSTQRKKLFLTSKNWLPIQIIWLYSKGLPYKQIASRLKCKLGVVGAAIGRFRKSGDIFEMLNTENKRPGPSEVIQQRHVQYLELVIRFHGGDITTRELRDALLLRFSDLGQVSIVTVWNAVKTKLNYSHKRVNWRNFRACRPERDHAIARFKTVIADLDRNEADYWASDECGVWLGKRSNYAWGLKGTNLVAIEEPNSHKKFSLILAISRKGNYAFQLIEGGVTGPVYASFLMSLAQSCGSSQLVMLCDNAPIHHSSICTAVRNHCNINTVFMPPYQPQSNPAEYFFCSMKTYLNTQVTSTTAELEAAILRFTTTSTPTYIPSLFAKASRETFAA